MIGLVFKPEAINDLQDIGDFIARDNLEAASAFVERLMRRCNDLTSFPLVGRKRDEISLGYRSVTEGEYILFYHLLDQDTVEIVRIIHSKRDLNRVFGS